MFLRDPSRSHVQTLQRSLVRVRPACLDGVLLRLLPALAQGEPFHYTACFFTCCISSSPTFRTKIGSNCPPLASSQCFPSQIEFSSCTICPPSLLRLRLFNIWRVKSNDLTCVPRAMCIVADVWPASPTCCRRPSQISEPKSSRRLDPSTRLEICRLFVRKLTRSQSRLSLASPSKWKTSCMHSKRIMHGRELLCVAAEIVQEPDSSPDLLGASCGSATEFRADLFDH